MYCVDDIDDGMGLPIQLPPTADERATKCICKPRPTPPPTPPPTTPSPPSPPLPEITVSFKEPVYSNIESGGNIVFTIQASQALNEAFSIGFCTENSSPLSAEGKLTIMQSR